MINCPDCNSKNDTSVTNGKHKCKKCLQYIIIENNTPICCIPKVIFE